MFSGTLGPAKKLNVNFAHGTLMIMMKWDDFNLNDLIYTPPLDYQHTIFVTILFKTLFQNPNQTFPFKIKGVGCLEACGLTGSPGSLWPNWASSNSLGCHIERLWCGPWVSRFTVPYATTKPTNPPGPIWRDNNSLLSEQWWLIHCNPLYIRLYFGGGLALQGRCTLRFSWE